MYITFMLPSILLLQFYWGDETQAQKAAIKSLGTDDQLDMGMKVQDESKMARCSREWWNCGSVSWNVGSFISLKGRTQNHMPLSKLNDWCSRQVITECLSCTTPARVYIAEGDRIFKTLFSCNLILLNQKEEILSDERLKRLHKQSWVSQPKESIPGLQV